MLVTGTGTSSQLAEELLDAISAVRRALRREAGAVAEAATLTAAQLQLVRVVHRRPGVSVADAAVELGVAPNTVSTLVHQLLAAAVLERRSGPPDRRVAQLFVCEAVAESLGEWLGRRATAIAAAAETLSDDDLQVIAGAHQPLLRLAAAIGKSGVPL